MCDKCEGLNGVLTTKHMKLDISMDFLNNTAFAIWQDSRSKKICIIDQM